MYQEIEIIGNLGRDPELKYAPSGTPFCSFSVAVNDRYTNKDGEKVDNTAWFRCTIWNKMAEVVNQYLHKGSKVLVKGRLQFDTGSGGPVIFTRKDGTAGASFEITANTVKFLDPKGNGESAEAEAPAAVADDSMPF